MPGGIHKLQFNESCKECGGLMRRGYEAEIVMGGGFVHRGKCPEPSEKKIREVNQPQRFDPSAIFWERVCLKCKTTHTGKIGTPIPARCHVTTYSPRGEPCGGEWVDPDTFVAETEAERPAWLDEAWKRHGDVPIEEKVPEGEEDNIFREALKNLRPVEVPPGPDDDIPF